MSETLIASAKLKTRRSGPVDKEALAQVEKWMAIIREVVQEQSKN
jgi:hypothetical protein